MTRSFQVEGIVLKRINYGEGDRIVTRFTKESGKVTALAKGIRKISSKRAASLEIGTRTKCYIHSGKGMDIITQTVFLENFSRSRQNLVRITQLQQILEIIDLLTVEAQPAPEVYRVLIHTLQGLEKQSKQKGIILSNIRQILVILGFTFDKEFTEEGLKRYIEELGQKRLKTKQFLIPKQKSLDVK